MIFQATAVKSTTFYKLFTTYVNLALRQMVTSVLILYPKYTLSWRALKQTTVS